MSLICSEFVCLLVPRSSCVLNARILKIFLIALVIASVFVGSQAFGQAVGGAVSGTVKDQQGGVLPNAAALVRNVDTGVITTATSNNDGLYRLANLQPGHYNLTVTMPGFSIGARNDINVSVGAEVTVDFALKIASTSEKVDVTTGTESNVDLTTSTLSYDVSGRTIRELPLNGRDYTSLATLQPGVASIGTSGGMRAGLGNKLSISGTRPSANNFLFDGISINDSGNNTPGSILGVTLGVDAVDQFTLLTDTFPAEYGNAAGGVINAVTRSGTNAYHGSAFYFVRNSAFDARNYFASGSIPKPQFRRHQYGASAGGPIKRDKAFWFADFEAVAQYLGTATTSTVPTSALRSGLYNSGTANPVKYIVDPDIAKALALYPLPNGAAIDAAGNTANYTTVLNQVAHENYLLGKADYKLSEKDSVRGSYFIDLGDLNQPDSFKNMVTSSKSRRQGVSMEYTRVISPSIVNVARFGFTRSVATSGDVAQVLNPAINDLSLGFVPGKTIGSIVVAGLTTLSAGPTSNDRAFANYNSFQEYENLYITKGKHTMKFGVNFNRMQYNSSQPNLFGGQFSYGSLPGFITNGTQGTFPSITFAALLLNFNYNGINYQANGERGMRLFLMGGYAQDDWRIRNNLTLNLGIRYEATTKPGEVRGLIALLRNPTDPAPRIGGPIDDKNPTLKNFSPRVGFSWDPKGNGQTALRAGFGVFDNLPLLNNYDTPLFRSFPFFAQEVLTASQGSPSALNGSFPGKAYSLGGANATSLRTAYVDPAPPRSYTMQWNVNVQHQIAGWVATVGYVGSRGVHLVQVERNLNTVQPTLTEAGWFYPARTTSAKLNKNVSTINTTATWNADSSYNALHVSVNRSLSRGLQVRGSYAWAKSFDDSSSTSSVTAGSGYATAIGNPAPLFPMINRGFSDFDMRHNGVISAVYETPRPNMSYGFINSLLGNWQVGGIYRIQTGMPFTAVLNNDPVYVNPATPSVRYLGATEADTTGGALGMRPNQVPGCGSLVNPGNVTNYINRSCFVYPAQVTVNGVGGIVIGNERRNALTAPGFQNMDFSLVKNDRIGERFSAQLRVEFFNVFNHPNFAAPAYAAFDSNKNSIANFGRITSTTNAARQMQLGLKLSF